MHHLVAADDYDKRRGMSGGRLSRIEQEVKVLPYVYREWCFDVWNFFVETLKHKQHEF